MKNFTVVSEETVDSVHQDGAGPSSGHLKSNPLGLHLPQRHSQQCNQPVPCCCVQPQKMDVSCAPRDVFCQLQAKRANGGGRGLRLREGALAEADCIQPRTKGAGHGLVNRAFYARKKFLAHFLGI